MRILHLPLNVAGGPQGLAEGERQLGHQADLLTIERPAFGFDTGRLVDIRSGGPLARLWRSARLLAELRSDYDLYDFTFGSSLLHFPRAGLPHLDLPLYNRRARKVFTYQGCDARQRDVFMQRRPAFSACADSRCYDGACLSGQRDRQRRRAIEVASRHADHMFALNPDLLWVLPEGKSSFLPYAIAGFHRLPRKTKPFFADDRLHVVHAPTQRGAKGTGAIIGAFEWLAAEFPTKFRFTLVEGRTVEEARRLYADADLLVDQVMVGWYGGVAVEAMKIGLPVIAHVDEELVSRIPAAMAAELPIIRATPFTIEAVLRELIHDREQLMGLAAQGDAFVARWHDPARVAQMMLDALPADGRGL